MLFFDVKAGMGRLKKLLGSPLDKVVLPSPVVAQGWVFVSLKSLLAVEGVRSCLEAVRATKSVWVGQCSEEWFKALRVRNRASLVQLALSQHSDEKQSLVLELQLKRQISVSAVLFGFSVPGRLWQMDKGVLEDVLRYLVLCERVQNDPVMCAAQLEAATPSYDALVERLSKNAWVSSLLASQSFPANFVTVRNALLLDKSLNYLITSDLVLRKALSSLLLIVGVDVPRDWLYVDSQVKEYVLRVGRYACVKRAKLSIVT